MPPMSRTWSAKPFSTIRRTPDPKAASSSLAAATSRLEGLAPYAPSCFGKRFYALVIYSAIIGFAGSLISLFLSKQMAKAPMGVRIIGEPRRDLERRLISAVRLQADRASITMLEVGIFDRSWAGLSQSAVAAGSRPKAPDSWGSSSDPFGNNPSLL